MISDKQWGARLDAAFLKFKDRVKDIKRETTGDAAVDSLVEAIDKNLTDLTFALVRVRDWEGMRSLAYDLNKAANGLINAAFLGKFGFSADDLKRGGGFEFGFEMGEDKLVFNDRAA